MATLPRLVWLLPSVMLIIALAKLPYGYYTLLRIVVTVCAIVLAAEIKKRDNIGAWFVAFVFVALLFNPLIPIHLTRGVWAPIDVGCALMFAAHMYFVRDRKW